MTIRILLDNNFPLSTQVSGAYPIRGSFIIQIPGSGSFTINFDFTESNNNCTATGNVQGYECTVTRSINGQVLNCAVTVRST